MFKKFSKKAFVWLLFKKEMIFFLIGLAVGVALTYLIASGILPIGRNICPGK